MKIQQKKATSKKIAMAQLFTGELKDFGVSHSERSLGKEVFSGGKSVVMIAHGHTKAGDAVVIRNAISFEEARYLRDKLNALDLGS